MKWIKINEKLPDGDFIIKLKVDKRYICLINTKGVFYATAAKCPHAGADMSTGWVKDNYFICPVHRNKYSLQTGKGADGQGDYLPIYQIESRKDGIYIGIKQTWLGKIFGH